MIATLLLLAGPDSFPFEAWLREGRAEVRLEPDAAAPSIGLHGASVIVLEARGDFYRIIPPADFPDGHVVARGFRFHWAGRVGDSPAAMAASTTLVEGPFVFRSAPGRRSTPPSAAAFWIERVALVAPHAN